MREVTIPALSAGWSTAGPRSRRVRDRRAGVRRAPGDDAELAAAARARSNRSRSTAPRPPIAPVLELHGWGDLQPELTRSRSRARGPRWATLIDDEVLHAFAVVGSPQEVGRGIVERFDGLLTRANFYAPYEHDPAIWAEVLAAARSHSVCQPQGCPGRSSTNRPSVSATS